VDGDGQFVLGGSLTLLRDGVEILTKQNVGGTVQFDIRTVGRYCVKPNPPTGYTSDSQVECLTTGDRLRFIWRKATTPTPTWTRTPTRTAAPTWTATATRTASPSPTALTPMPPTPPTGTPPVPQPPTPGARLWALLSAFGDWKLVGDMPGAGRLAGLSYLSIPEEHYELIRRQTYAALGSPLPLYDMWERTPFWVALRLTGVDVLTPVVIVTDEGGAAIYRAVRTTGGILVMKP
jgi:hypothetical protein